MSRPEPTLAALAPDMGARRAFIAIPGFLSRDLDPARYEAEWVRPLRRAGWHGSIHVLAWQSGDTGEMLLQSARAAADLFIAWRTYRHSWVTLMSLLMPAAFAARRMKLLLGAAGVLYTVQRTAVRAHRYWRRARNEAQATARRLAEAGFVDQLPMPPSRVTLAGFSLGGYLLRELLIETANEGARVHQAFCIAGAVRADDPAQWQAAQRGACLPLINVYSPNDLILRTLYTSAEWHMPAGLAHVREPAVVNVNAARHLPSGPANVLASHLGHMPALTQTIGPWLHYTGSQYATLNNGEQDHDSTPRVPSHPDRSASRRGRGPIRPHRRRT